MAKFFGKIGFEEYTETLPSVYAPTIVEREYAGDISKNYRRLDSGEGVNDDINLSNEISIVGDPYALNHFHTMRYLYWHDGYWKITGVSVEFPRLKLTIGGVYNGPTLST